MSIGIRTTCVNPRDGKVCATNHLTFTQPPEPISVSIKDIEIRSFVPLGIENYKKRGKTSDKIKISYEIGLNPAEEGTIEIYKNDHTLTPIGKIILTDLDVGEHSVGWDGFDENGVYDSKMVLDKLTFKITVESADGNNDMAEKDITVEREIKWLDVRIDKNDNIKRIDVTLRIDFRDGGVKGLKRNVPESVVVNVGMGQPPIQDTSSNGFKSFWTLKELAKEGLRDLWGRNNGRGVATDDGTYNVYIDVTDDRVDNMEMGYMSSLRLIFNTNGKYMRSRNPGRARDALSHVVGVFPGRLIYNAGYIDISDWWSLRKDWQFYHGWASIPVFKYHAAHEIGHELLQAFVGTFHSYMHKKTSTPWQTPNKNAPFYPPQISGDEMDVMVYYKERGNIDFRKFVASEADVLGLIWLINISEKGDKK